MVFKVVSLPLFILKHKRIQKFKSFVCNVSVPTYKTTWSYIPETIVLVVTPPGLLK